MHLLKPRGSTSETTLAKKGGGWLKVCSVFLLLLLLQRRMLSPTTLRPKRLGYAEELPTAIFYQIALYKSKGLGKRTSL